MSGERKTDRRTIYTLNVIQTAFLELIDQQPFAKITVAQLCRQAEITRSTFYLHYANLNEVLNAVLDQALMFNQPLRLDDEEGSMLPACQRIAGSAKYRRLLMDPDLSEYVVARIARHEQGRAVPQIMLRTGLSKEEASSLFTYILHGSLAINKRHHFTRSPEWFRDVKMIQKFVNGGYQALRQKENH
ncbi:TetR family transcriptional regulator [uncultured Limosilactobacillus sp.]|uniref:TetR/AcrR family transcriptional regulator n=1 Tax=uncultured Limosilactobacillus sp. TaxID=2837629 RepID=UPI0025F48F94|nr:TetR family transcriptional regulator [uncultured Limosilactobacillus sp.]